MNYSNLKLFFAALIFAFCPTQSIATQNSCDLCTAVENEDIKLVTELSEDNAKLSELNEKGMWPLFLAIAKDNKKIAKILIDAGADTNQTDEHGVSALIGTVMADKPKFAKMLIQGGANPNIQSMPMNSNALHLAAGQGRDRVFKELLKTEVDLELKNQKGKTALLLASTKSKNIVDMLLDAGANPNHADESSLTPMHAIVMLKDKKLVAKAIKAGADINLAKKKGTTPLMHAAIAKNNTSVIALLVENGANTEAKMKVNGATALHLTVMQNRMKNMKKLLQLNVDVDALDDSKRTPLMYAVSNNNFDAAKLLIERGANPDLVNEDGKSPRDLAIDSPRLLALFNEGFK